MSEDEPGAKDGSRGASPPPTRPLAGGDHPMPGTGAAAMEIAAVLLLAVGGLVFLPAWIAGVILLWVSPRWQRGDKLLGTLIWPGGLAAARLVLHLVRGPVYFHAGWVGSAPLMRRTADNAYFVAAHLHPVLRLLLLVVLGIPPVLVGIRLLRRARPPQATSAAS